MKSNKEIEQLSNLLILKTSDDGGQGILCYLGKQIASVIWSEGFGWEHVSVSPFKKKNIPSWEDMCRLKEMFFKDDEAVIQIHPRKADYVNFDSNCLHLWRPTDEHLPLPPTFMVGPRIGQSISDCVREGKEFMDAYNRRN